MVSSISWVGWNRTWWPWEELPAPLPQEMPKLGQFHQMITAAMRDLARFRPLAFTLLVWPLITLAGSNPGDMPQADFGILPNRNEIVIIGG